MTGVLYVVGTPIGNLGDMTHRAVEVLRGVDTVFCEDTRVTRTLLVRYAITVRCSSYHSFSGFGKIARAVSLLRQGKDVALVSDAGTPTISDPGVKFVRHVREALGDAADVRAVPGPSALVAALSISGAPSSSFVFFGFLPRKKGRLSLFEEIAAEKRTVVCYEAPHRLLKSLESLRVHIDPMREVIVVREMTKVYEQVVAGTAEEVFAYYTAHPDEVRGEVVLIVSALHRKV